MSLVGPRPPIDYEVTRYTPSGLRRPAGPAGLTGSWQVNGRSTLTFDEMVDLDTSYLNRQSLLLDLTIIVRTLGAVVARQGARADMDRLLQVAAIGSGYWGPNLIRNFVEIPHCELRAIADLSSVRLEAMRARAIRHVEPTTDYRTLFDMDLNAVVIYTPPHTHHQIAKDCLQHGLHVLVEKPMATTSADAQDLIDVAEQHDRVLMVGHTFIYNSQPVQALKQMMADGSLGDIHYIDAVRVGLGLYHPTVNVVWDLAPHDVSILMYLLDATPVLVSAEAAACVQPSVEDVAYLTLMFPDGILTHVRVGWARSIEDASDHGGGKARRWSPTTTSSRMRRSRSMTRAWWH